MSMIISWNEVPCTGRNGPITGYYLTYTNIISKTSYTVNITGSDNRMYTLTRLIPYTNYTVSIIPYNYNEMGPSRQGIQLTLQSSKSMILISYLHALNTDPGMISDLMQTSATLTEIGITWNPPRMPNGIITVYEIRYGESNTYNVTNTTNTQYSIVGLIPNTSYTIGVRAYTSVGPGEWIDEEYSSAKIRKIVMHSLSIILEFY